MPGNQLVQSGRSSTTASRTREHSSGVRRSSSRGSIGPKYRSAVARSDVESSLLGNQKPAATARGLRMKQVVMNAALSDVALHVQELSRRLWGDGKTVDMIGSSKPYVELLGKLEKVA